MHAYFRNHQLYLAEKSTWLDRQVEKNSKRALMKIESLKLIAQSDDQEQTRMVKKLVKDTLLTVIHNKILLQKEGFYKINLNRARANFLLYLLLSKIFKREINKVEERLIWSLH